MTALLRANCPWAAHVALLRLRGVVLALAKAAADRMNRRQIEHVESHLLHVIQLRGDIAQRAMLSRLAPGARKQLVPAGEARPLAIHPHAQCALVAGLHFRLRIPVHDRQQRSRQKPL